MLESINRALHHPPDAGPAMVAPIQPAEGDPLSLGRGDPYGRPENDGVLTDEELEPIREQVRYVVRLPVFEGPLDLLLHLIEKRQMEITTISLVAVTDQYLAYLRQYNMIAGDDLASENGLASQDNAVPEQPMAPTRDATTLCANMAAFVSIAARLLFIKSQSLLPQNPKGGMSSEAEQAAVMAEELQRHLLEYKFAKEVASYLRKREEEGLQTYGRSALLAGIEAQLTWTPPTLVGLEAHSLASTFQRLLEVRSKDEANGVELIPPMRLKVSECIATILELLSGRPSIELAELIENDYSRLILIVTFLAILELWKRERISVRQEVLFGPIILERGAAWSEEVREDEVEE